MRLIDEKLYRWERNYFPENLVWNVCRITLDKTESDTLETELAALAGRCREALETKMANPPYLL